jgi:hypothetical protein
MINPIINFSLKLAGVLGVVFAIHIGVLYYLNLPLFENLIIASYLTNFILATLIYAMLYLLQNKYLDMLGFIFMGGSFLKFGIYFIFFHPQFKQDDIILKLEATSFLIPYLSSLIVETYFLVKLLNKAV